MTKHESRDGKIRECKASPGQCPLNTPHGETEAEVLEAIANSEEVLPDSSAEQSENAGVVGYFTRREAELVAEVLGERHRAEAKRIEKSERLARKRGHFTPKELERRLNFVNEQTSILVQNGVDTESFYSRETPNGRVYEPERARLHTELVESYMEKHAHVPRESKAIMAGGVGGSGKGYVLSNAKLAAKDEYATVNPDDVKEEMARRGFVPQVHSFTPMESSTLVHEEASHVSKLIAYRLRSERRNVVYDATMGGFNSTTKKITDLRQDGYEVSAVFVDVPASVSEERAVSRYEISMGEWVREENSIGGRPLDKKHIRQQRTDGPANSKNAENFVELARGLNLKSPRVFDNNTGGAPREIPFESFADSTERR